MQSLQCTILLVLLAGVQLGRSAPRQPAAGGFFLLPRPPFNFPEAGPKDEPKESPEPRHLVLEPGQLSQKDLSQLLFVDQLGQGRSAEERGMHGLFHKKDDKDKNPVTLVIVNGFGGYPNFTNNIVNVANATDTTVDTPTTTRTVEFLRAPIGYPMGYPMQYFRKRGDEEHPVGYPSMYGWNEPSMYSGLAGGYGGGLGGLGLNGLRGGYNGLTGGLNGGLNGGLTGGLNGGLAGVPLVPVAIGNEVRYVPLNLRMFRQLVNLPVREKDDVLEEDDLTPFAANGGQDPEEVANEDQAPNEGEAAYAPMGQKRIQRRRRPLQTLGQKLRQVQYL